MLELTFLIFLEMNISQWVLSPGVIVLAECQDRSVSSVISVSSVSSHSSCEPVDQVRSAAHWVYSVTVLQLLKKCPMSREGCSVHWYSLMSYCDDTKRCTRWQMSLEHCTSFYKFHEKSLSHLELFVASSAVQGSLFSLNGDQTGNGDKVKWCVRWPSISSVHLYICISIYLYICISVWRHVTCHNNVTQADVICGLKVKLVPQWDA